jgi:hypothetical protein
MKLCPRCKSSYTDITLVYCLQDGAALIHLTDESSSESRHTHETLILSENITHDPRKDPTDVMEQTAATQEQRVHPATNKSDPYTAAPKQNTALIVVLSVLVTLILGVLAIGGLWFVFKDRFSNQVTSNNNNGDSNTNDSNQNKNQSKNTNNSNKENTNATPSPTPTPKPIDTAKIREEVSAVLDGWSSAARAHDLELQLRFYADKVSPYYNASSYSLSQIKAQRERVYAMYDTIDVDLTNIKITPDPSGDKATAVFDKTWTFEGPEKFNSGSVQQKLWLANIGGRWKITGEKDLKIYYVNKE